MEMESLLTSTKWTLLCLIAKEPMNPLELAKRIGTSIANVSQQLRLLEVAGLVKKEKVSNRDRGKPRMNYSLAKDTLYVAVLSKDIQEKSLLKLTEPQKQILKKWLREG